MLALILVDVQHDFLPGGALAVPEGDQVVPVANRIALRFPLVVATQDWHPAGHESFAAAHPGRSPGERINLHGLEQVLWPVHCVQGTTGAELAPGLDREPIARVFPKGTDPTIDSYSGFFDNGRRQATGLEDFLREHGVRHVFVAGLATDYCVQATALDARELGFETTLITDGCRGVELRPGDVERALERMRLAGIRLRTADETLAELAASGEDRGELTTLASGRFLRLVRRGTWEFAQRTTRRGAVGIVAVTEDRQVVLVEQYRPPVGARVIEVPAGLVGDYEGARQGTTEPRREAAIRELEEETGYHAGACEELGTCVSSAGLTDETMTYFLASQLTRRSAGGGVSGESITVHLVPLDELDSRLAQWQRSGLKISAHVHTALRLAGL